MNEVCGEIKKRMNIARFEHEGYLQEANRNFFHPLGLSLAVEQEPCAYCEGSNAGCEECDFTGIDAWISGVHDFREDEDGIFYCDGAPSMTKARAIAKQWAVRFHARVHKIGWMVQPCVYDLPSQNGHSEERP